MKNFGGVTVYPALDAAVLQTVHVTAGIVLLNRLQSLPSNLLSIHYS
jgi:hypothetical protein